MALAAISSGSELRLLARSRPRVGRLVERLSELQQAFAENPDDLRTTCWIWPEPVFNSPDAEYLELGGHYEQARKLVGSSNRQTDESD